MHIFKLISTYLYSYHTQINLTTNEIQKLKLIEYILLPPKSNNKINIIMLIDEHIFLMVSII